MAENLTQLIRLVSTDLNGKKPLLAALADISGVGFMFANAICKVLNLDSKKRLGVLTQEELKNIEQVVINPQKYNIPSWLLNRRKDPETGNNIHLSATQLLIAKDNDIKQMKKIKSYKGVRHILGQPVRGQRTRSNFRKNKGKVKLGVKVSTGSKKGGK